MSFCLAGWNGLKQKILLSKYWIRGESENDKCCSFYTWAEHGRSGNSCKELCIASR